MASGKKRVFSLKDLHSIFEKYQNDIVRNDGGILKPSDEFWQNLNWNIKFPIQQSQFTPMLGNGIKVDKKNQKL